MAQTRAWCFTLNNPEEDEQHDMAEWPDCKYLIYQLELGEEGTLHHQGYCEFGKAKRLAAVRRLLPHAHWEPRKGTAQQAIDYCRKEDTACTDPVEQGTPSAGQGQRTDLEDFRDAVLAGVTDRQLVQEHLPVVAKYPKLARTIRMASRSAEEEQFALTELRPWQDRIVQLLAGPIHPREIIWIYDENGGVGKSALAKHLVAQGAFYSSGGKYADILYSYELQRVCVFNFPRSAADHVCYPVLESLKDGIITVSKYESCTRTFPVPHVVVFANFQPDRSALSADRWCVHHILEPFANVGLLPIAAIPQPENRNVIVISSDDETDGDSLDEEEVALVRRRKI